MVCEGGAGEDLFVFGGATSHAEPIGTVVPCLPWIMKDVAPLLLFWHCYLESNNSKWWRLGGKGQAAHWDGKTA